MDETWEVWVTSYRENERVTYPLEAFDNPVEALMLFKDCVKNIDEGGGLIEVHAAKNSSLFASYPTFH